MIIAPVYLLCPCARCGLWIRSDDSEGDSAAESDGSNPISDVGGLSRTFFRPKATPSATTKPPTARKALQPVFNNQDTNQVGHGDLRCGLSVCPVYIEGHHA